MPRLLIVEDQKKLLSNLQRGLEEKGYEVITAATVDEALEKVALVPAVMLVDYHLHDRLDGLETLAALRAASATPIAGALLTADGRDELKQRARELGYHLLTKPVKPASLRAFLAAHHHTVTA
jgi:DNA-binding response OmpR family regulator